MRGKGVSQTGEPDESRESDRWGGFNYKEAGAKLLKNL